MLSPASRKYPSCCATKMGKNAIELLPICPIDTSTEAARAIDGNPATAAEPPSVRKMCERVTMVLSSSNGNGGFNFPQGRAPFDEIDGSVECDGKDRKHK